MSIIFYFSNQPAEISRIQSGKILVDMEVLKSGEETIVGDSRIFQLQKLIRKSAHFIEYCGLGTLMTLSIYFMNTSKIYIKGWSYSTIYAASDEIHQYFIPGRGAMLRDVYLDSIAALTGTIIIFIIIKVLNKRFRF
jgi:VanZ family protein